MPNPLSTPGCRRKRVLHACEPCRSMKSKCDGIRPACGRCVGYGYHCAYSSSGRKKSNKVPIGSQHDPLACCRLVESLRATISKYETLITDDILASLIRHNKDDLAGKLKVLRQHTEDNLKGPPHVGSLSNGSQTTPSPSPLAPSPAPLANQGGRPIDAERYLGEVSDVRFFNLVDRVLQEQIDVAVSEEAGGETMESYEQNGPSAETVAATTSQNSTAVGLGGLAMPEPDVAEGYLEIYFSTIHVAYPFIPQAPFIRSYQEYMQTRHQLNAGRDTCWLATLYIIFAIGSYYASVSANADNKYHEQYFRQALILGETSATERSIGRVSFLLVQCFYLLAVCCTDRCWTTLGLAVRVAQSIGLHIDADAHDNSEPQSHSITGNHTLCGEAKATTLVIKNEVRRRVWHSLYVLDRLLALQLGRPPAIHDDDCHLQLPSRLGDGDIEWSKADSGGCWQLPPAAISTCASEEATSGDYFIRMISLSRIIGHVLRDLYSPRHAHNHKIGSDISTWLPHTQLLDGQLVAWKHMLPRSLRFDLGHTFETNRSFRRQRNMLAIKFHHLRALIYRPYLCLPLLRRMSKSETDSSEKEQFSDHSSDDNCIWQGKDHQLDVYERICIAEAQNTAHLLHNVGDKEDLVHDFPWWQMISCLICASSILVVASVFRCRVDNRNGIMTEMDGAANDSSSNMMTLEDDAETCLKVFEALSTNSEGARIARDMMRRLKARGQHWREAHYDRNYRHHWSRSKGMFSREPEDSSQQPAQVHIATPQLGLTTANTDVSDFVSLDLPDIPFGYQPTAQDVDIQRLQQWPSEILDSMAWSVQFFGAVG